MLNMVEKVVSLHLKNIRICATSRPEADIRAALARFASHAISLDNEDGQRKDITDYIKFIVYSDPNMRKWRVEEKEMVIRSLSRKADGMYVITIKPGRNGAHSIVRFRWTVCQLEALRNSFPSAIHRALDDLPESLDETYNRILLSIAQERREYAQRLLQCLAVSIRPLRVEELAEVLAIRFEAGKQPDYDVKWRPENSEDAVLSACSSLISIVDLDGLRVVQFSHFSVKEYLISERLASAGNHLSRYHIVPYQAHTILAQASLTVLLALDDLVYKDRMKNFPLIIYAARHWADHARFDNVFSNLVDPLERLFDPSKPHFATWVWVYDIDYPFREIMSAERPTPPEAAPLYYATLCGFRDLVEHLVDTCPQGVNARGGYHCSPLHAATIKGNIDVTTYYLFIYLFLNRIL
jgi:hypothetical protein